MTDKVNFDSVEEVPDVIEVPPVEEKAALPKYGSEEWNDYVLGLLTEDEKPKGNPTCAGLRRIVEDLLGEIVDTGPISVHSFSDAEGKMRATVIYRVVFAWKLGVEPYVDLNTFELPTKEFREVGEAWPGNTPAPFDVHAAATASTRAEGRALRKALKLKIATAEEMNSGNTNASPVMDSDDKANSFQKRMITSKCQALGIDVQKFSAVPVESLTHQDAAKLLDKLVFYTQDRTKIPQEIKQ